MVLKWSSPEETGSPQGSWHNGLCPKPVVRTNSIQRLALVVLVMLFVLFVLFVPQVQMNSLGEAASYYGKEDRGTFSSPFAERLHHDAEGGSWRGLSGCICAYRGKRRRPSVSNWTLRYLVPTLQIGPLGNPYRNRSAVPIFKCPLCFEPAFSYLRLAILSICESNCSNAARSLTSGVSE